MLLLVYASNKQTLQWPCFQVSTKPFSPLTSLVPRPRPAFRRLQYVLIATESWVGPGNEATHLPLFSFFF